MSVLMTAGDAGKWRKTPEPEKRLLLGRRLAQVLRIVLSIVFAVRKSSVPIVHILRTCIEIILFLYSFFIFFFFFF